jgi:hypothetical protein
MPKNKLEDLRNHLFETIERLKDKDDPMDVERAKAVASVAGVILDSAKVEIGFMRVTDQVVESAFLGTLVTSAPGRPPAVLTSGSPTGVQCIDCGDRFPDKAALHAHRSRSHRGAEV